MSIKVEWVNVNLLDDVSIYRNFMELPTDSGRALDDLVDDLVVGREQPLQSRGILLGGVEKAPRAGPGLKGESEPARSLEVGD